MTLPTSPGPADGTRLGSPALRAVLLVVLVLLLIASLVWLSAESLARRDGGVASSSGGSGGAAAEEREKVMSVSSQFVTRAFTYGPDDVVDGTLPGYEERVKELLSTSATAEFDKFQLGVQQMVEQFSQKQTVDVYGTGVAELADDSAQVLVAGALNTTWYAGTERETVDDPIQFRYRVDLVEVDGEWRIDEFQAVSAAPRSEEVTPQ